MSREIELLKVLRGDDKEDHQKGQVFRFAAIDPSYTSGRPKVKFDGETALSGRTYTYLASYTPAANDKVLMVKAGHSWVIIGKIV